MPAAFFTAIAIAMGLTALHAATRGQVGVTIVFAGLALLNSFGAMVN